MCGNYRAIPLRPSRLHRRLREVVEAAAARMGEFRVAVDDQLCYMSYSNCKAIPKQNTGDTKHVEDAEPVTDLATTV